MSDSDSTSDEYYEIIKLSPGAKEAFKEYKKIFKQAEIDYENNLKKKTIEFSKKYSDKLFTQSINEIVYWGSNCDMSRELSELAISTAEEFGAKKGMSPQQEEYEKNQKKLEELQELAKNAKSISEFENLMKISDAKSVSEFKETSDDSNRIVPRFGTLFRIKKSEFPNLL